jgi:hypothetical protein
MCSFRPVCNLKADGKVLATDPYKYWGYGWNDKDLTLSRIIEPVSTISAAFVWSGTRSQSICIIRRKSAEQGSAQPSAYSRTGGYGSTAVRILKPGGAAGDRPGVPSRFRCYA